MENKGKTGTRGVALGNRDEDIPPSRPDSPGGNIVEIGRISPTLFKQWVCTPGVRLVPFTFTCKPSDLPYDDYQDCWNEDFEAFWDGEDMIVSDYTSDARYKVVCFEKQRRASYAPYYTWYCSRETSDPCDNGYMQDISS